MNKILFLLLFIPLLICNPAYSQKKTTIKAKVISKEDGLPVIGATVLVKGTAIGTAARIDGCFDLQCCKTDVIEISAIGFVTQHIKMKDIKPGMHIQLVPDVVSLKEIAVVGYGVQERRDLTGSVSSVNIRELDKTSVSIDNALAGKVPGVLVNSSSGQPGSATSIIIRGLSSLSVSGEANNPLIVIDGIPVYGSGKNFNNSNFKSNSVSGASIGGNNVVGQLGANVDEFERNPLSNLNADDIESIEVLKDAFATAIYGSRGSAGVILITTKKGAKGKPKVNINYSMSVSEPVDLPNVLNGDEYRLIYGTLDNLASGMNANTNWIDEVTRKAFTHNISASVSAGGEKSSYYLSMSKLDQESYIINNDFSRTSARFNFNYKAKESISFGANASASMTDNNALNAGKIYSNAVVRPSASPIYDEDGTYNHVPEKRDDNNPLQVANDDINFLKDTRIIGNVFGEFKPTSWLTFKTEVGMDVLNSEAYSRLTARKGWLEGGSATQTTTSNFKYVFNNTLTAIKVFGDHSINAVVGQSFEKSRENRTSIGGSDFNSDNEISISLAKRKNVSQAAVQEWAILSAFTRINYRYKDRYMAGFTYRIDGSSKFNKNNRYLGFPSFSLGWRASEEEFMENCSFVNDLKFRGSIGFTGTDGSGGYYGNQGTYLRHSQGLQYGGKVIYNLNAPNNPNLKWEKTKSYDLGLDASFFDDRVKLTVDYYLKKITNMITNVKAANYKGWTYIKRNFGDMQNSGIEIDLYTENIKSDLMWTTNINLASNKSKITKLNIIDQPGSTIFVEGKSAPQFNLYEWAGVDELTGEPLWKYPDGSISNIPPASRTNSEDYKKTFGTYLPDIFGGIHNTFNYKGFELSAFFSFSYGGQMINGTKAYLMTYTTDDRNNLDKDILNNWIIPGQKTDVPALGNKSLIGSNDYTASTNTTRFLEDNSYIRLKTLTLSYTFSGNYMRKFGIRNLKLYAQGTNLLTFTKYSGIDPEVSAFGSNAVMGGYDLLTLPQSKTIQFGVNIGF